MTDLEYKAVRDAVAREIYGEKKRVRVDESGILSITNDNATWTNGDVTTDIAGEYSISADDLRRLMVMMTGQDMMHVRTIVNSWQHSHYPCQSSTSNTWITSNEAIAEEVEKMHMAYNKANSDLEDAKIECRNVKLNYNAVMTQIKKFNDSRHWWERKLNISSESSE
jgi:hypothetical protein